LEIYYKVKNNIIEEKILLAQERAKQLYNLRKALIDCFESTIKQQAKYYNKKHKLQSFAIKELFIFSTRNLKQRRSNKKILHKFVELFKIENKIETQAYCLILSNIYRIYNIFYISLLKLYLYRIDNK